MALVAGAAARAEPGLLVLDPDESAVRFRLGATLHTVEGEGRVLEGRIHFDTESLAAAGHVAIDARSFDTGNDTRDATMHADVLQSERHPRIAFEPRGLSVVERSQDEARIRLRGTLVLVGAAQPVEIPLQVVRLGDGRIRATGEVVLPYVEWGLPDVSNFLLRVDPEVTVEIDVVGALELGRGFSRPTP